MLFCKHVRLSCVINAYLLKYLVTVVNGQHGQWSVMIMDTPAVPSPCPVPRPSKLKLLSHRRYSDDRARRNTHSVIGRSMTGEFVDQSTSVSLQQQQQLHCTTTTTIHSSVVTSTSRSTTFSTVIVLVSSLHM